MGCRPPNTGAGKRSGYTRHSRIWDRSRCRASSFSWIAPLSVLAGSSCISTPNSTSSACSMNRLKASLRRRFERSSNGRWPRRITRMAVSLLEGYNSAPMNIAQSERLIVKRSPENRFLDGELHVERKPARNGLRRSREHLCRLHQRQQAGHDCRAQHCPLPDPVCVRRYNGHGLWLGHAGGNSRCCGNWFCAGRFRLETVCGRLRSDRPCCDPDRLIQSRFGSADKRAWATVAFRR